MLQPCSRLLVLSLSLLPEVVRALPAAPSADGFFALQPCSVAQYRDLANSEERLPPQKCAPQRLWVPYFRADVFRRLAALQVRAHLSCLMYARLQLPWEQQVVCMARVQHVPGDTERVSAYVVGMSSQRPFGFTQSTAACCCVGILSPLGGQPRGAEIALLLSSQQNGARSGLQASAARRHVAHV
jgi:hypothetical protein